MDEQQTRSKKTEAADNEDIISNLSDGIVPYILSFMPTKDAVKTSQVSKNWKSFWTYVPTLDLSDIDFPPKDRKQDFLAFIDRFLMENPLPLSKFRLSCSGCYTLSHINSWVCAAVERNAKELHLDAYVYEEPFPNRLQRISGMSVALFLHPSDRSCPSRVKCSSSSVMEYWVGFIKERKVKDLELKLDFSTNFKEIHKFPRTLITLDMLRVLKLQGGVLINFPMLFIGFPNLKVLHLWNIKFEDNDSSSDFINYSCPVLEEFELDLDHSHFKEIPKVPRNLFAFEKLVVLKLRGEMVLCFPRAPVRFVNLKVLHLWKVKFRDEDSACNFINGSCPALQELDIHRSDSDNIVNLIISSQTLERLKVHFTGATIDAEFKTTISAPSLRYLDLYDMLTSEYIVGGLDRLIKAKLQVCKCCKSQPYDETGYASCLFKLFQNLCNVKCLSLSDHTMLALQKSDSYDMPMFLNLTRLEILGRARDESITWKLMQVFLKSCPKIKDFFFEKMMIKDSSKQETPSNHGEESNMAVEQDVFESKSGTVNQIVHPQSGMDWLTSFWAELNY